MLLESARVMRESAHDGGERAAYDRVAKELSAIAEAGPDAEAVALLAKHRELIRALGLSRKVLDVLDAWRLAARESSASLEDTALAYAIDVDAQGGLQRLERRASERKRLGPLIIIAAARSQGLLRAVEEAESADWMVGDGACLESFAEAT